jgi:hypothetical protein
MIGRAPYDRTHTVRSDAHRMIRRAPVRDFGENTFQTSPHKRCSRVGQRAGVTVVKHLVRGSMCAGVTSVYHLAQGHARGCDICVTLAALDMFGALPVRANSHGGLGVNLRTMCVNLQPVGVNLRTLGVNLRVMGVK